MKKHGPLLISLAVVLGLVVLVAVHMIATMGRIEYALDDPYIHMAVAKHFAEYGVWGMTRYEFSSSSSSLLWTCLLAGLRVMHVRSDFVPLALNVLFAGSALVVFDAILRRNHVDGLTRAGALLGIVFMAPIVPVVYTGMEHTLQIVLTVVFLYLASRSLAKPASAVDRWLLALSPLLTGLRYEGMFPLVLVCGAFVLKRRWRYAISLGALGFAPIVAFGLYAMSRGWYFFPNTLLMKAKPPTQPLALLKYLIGFLGNGRYVGLPAIFRFPYITSLFLALVLGIVILWREGRRLRDANQLFLLLTLGSLLLHMQFARIGWFYRYEAYLYAGTILAVVLALHDRLRAWLTPGASWTSWIRPGVAVLLLGAPMGHGLKGLPDIERTARRIYEYEVQAARFLGTYYTGESVMIGEIGAMNYFADIRAFDYEGLGSIESARVLIRDGRLPPEELARIARERHAKIALGHVDVFNQMQCVPKEWILVAEWDAHDPTRVDWTERFYAIDPQEADRLRQSLQSFSGTHLPWVETRLIPTPSVVGGN